MSDTESSGNVNVSVSLPPPSKPETSDVLEQTSDRLRSEINANTDLDQVKEILKATRDGDPLEDKDSFYPLSQKTAYMSPVTTLSSESKRIIRQAQVPILQASPRVVHFLYEVCSDSFRSNLLSSAEWQDVNIKYVYLFSFGLAALF